MVCRVTASASVNQLHTSRGFFDRPLVDPFRPAVAGCKIAIPIRREDKCQIFRRGVKNGVE
jgi:hypothetical protein